MKVFLTIPNWTNPHGGLRVILEWANRLTAWHDVYLFNMKGERSCNWFDIDPVVNLCREDYLHECDCVILTSPHSSYLLDRIENKKCFLFIQMMEHLFKPNDKVWFNDCTKFYTAPYPMFSISKWNIQTMEDLGRKGTTYYIGNGVNFKDFPIERPVKDGKTILIEGWECTNPSKDSQLIAHSVAKKLRNEGYYLISYGGPKLRTNAGLLHEYYCKPNIRLLNALYARATIMIKASLFDARSCSPVEALTKHTPTARAIQKGDDDLIDGVNCLRCDYNAEDLYTISKRLLDNPELRDSLAETGVKQLKKYDWNYWMNHVNEIICKD